MSAATLYNWKAKLGKAPGGGLLSNVVGPAVKMVPFVAATAALSELTMQPSSHTGEDITSQAQVGMALGRWLLGTKPADVGIKPIAPAPPVAASPFGVLRPTPTGMFGQNSNFGLGGGIGHADGGLSKGMQPIADSINRGLGTFAAVADGFPNKGLEFGEQAGGGILGTAFAWGAKAGEAAGASLVAAASGIRIGVDAPKSVPNTGSPGPIE